LLCFVLFAFCGLGLQGQIQGGQAGVRPPPLNLPQTTCRNGVLSI